MKYILTSPQPFQQKQSGLTLIELLIAMFLGTLLILGATSMFIANKRVYKEVDFQGRLAENARFGMEMMIRDLRMAGFRGCAVNQDVENNLNVKNIKLQSLKNNSFDLCVMFDVLEHLTKPISEFKILRKKVKRGGHVICYSPNIYSLAFELMGENQNQVYPFEHLYFFGKKTLEIFARKSGFKIVNYEVIIFF